MKRDEILEELDSSRDRLLIALETLPDGALLQPGVTADWSVADVLVHLTAWESELVTGLMRIDQGKKPTKLTQAYADVDGYNARRHIENKDRDLDRIFDDLQGVRLQLEQWLEDLSDKDLEDPKRYGWAKGRALWQIIEENSFGHEAEHIPDIEAFAARYHRAADGGQPSVARNNR